MTARARTPTPSRRRRSRERGQAMTEYVLAVGALMAVAFLPVIPNPEAPGTISLFFLFIRNFDIYINSFHYVISLPIP